MKMSLDAQGSGACSQRVYPAKTIVNIGATPDGIGAVYELAKRKGFFTTGIVSSQAKQYHLMSTKPSMWKIRTGAGSCQELNNYPPTSKAMVENSDVIVGIGGGEVARDELIAAKRLGKKVRFIPAEMNDQKARESARKKKLPSPLTSAAPRTECSKVTSTSIGNRAVASFDDGWTTTLACVQ